MLCCRLIPSIDYKELPIGSSNLFNDLMYELNTWKIRIEQTNRSTGCDKMSQGANGSGAKYDQEDAHFDDCASEPGK
jgi:hypothetical protein